jgi:hypothetical protein
LASCNFNLFWPLKKQLGGHRFQTFADVYKAVLWWFHSQSPKLCRRLTFTDNTLLHMPEPSGWLCGKISHCSVFSW